MSLPIPKRFAGQSAINAGYHNYNWELFFDGNVHQDVSHTSLSTALTYLGTSDNKTLVISSTHRITSNLTVSPNIQPAFEKGGYLDTPSGVTVTMRVPKAGRYRIFHGSGSVEFSDSGEVYPEWWGAMGDGTTNDYAALNSCLASITNSYDLGGGGSSQIVLAGNYKVNTGLILPDRVDLVGKSHATGNLNRNTARLDFSSMGTSTNAITLGEDNVLRGLVISGPGEGVSGTYGIYGGLEYTEGFGVNCRLFDCTIEDFETGVILSGWLNKIIGCKFDDCITGLILQHAANGTVVMRNDFEIGSASPKVQIHIKYQTDRAPENVQIVNNAIEASYDAIVCEAGEGILIAHNRFEITNHTFIDVRGRNAASDADLSVDVHHNYFLDYGANASGGGRSGILWQAGRITVDDNEIGRYDSGANTGLTYAFNVGGNGIKYDCLIGKNRFDAYSPFPDYAIALATRELIRSRLHRVIDYTWDLADNPGDSVEIYFRFAEQNGYTAKVLFREFAAFNLDAIQDATGSNVAIGEINVGYREATPSVNAYMDNFELTDSNANTVTRATDTEWTTAGEAFFSPSDSRIYLMRFEPGLAVSGRIHATLLVDEFQH